MNGHSREGFREKGVSVMDREGRGLGSSAWLEARALSGGHSRRQEEEEEDDLFCSVASSLPGAYVISFGIYKTGSSETVEYSG